MYVYDFASPKSKVFVYVCVSFKDFVTHIWHICTCSKTFMLTTPNVILCSRSRPEVQQCSHHREHATVVTEVCCIAIACPIHIYCSHARFKKSDIELDVPSISVWDAYGTQIISG